MKYNEDYLNVRKSVCVCLCVYMCVWVTLLKSRLIDHYKSTIIENIKILQKKKKKTIYSHQRGWLESHAEKKNKRGGEGKGGEERGKKGGRQAGRHGRFKCRASYTSEFSFLRLRGTGRYKKTFAVKLFSYPS